MRARLTALAARFGPRLGRFVRSKEGVAAVELALLTPVALAVLGLAAFGGEGLGIQRKVTLAARTVADLVGQTATSSTGNNTGTATLNKTVLDYYLSLTALIVYPYDPSQLQARVSELQVITGTNTAKVIWSEGYNGYSIRAVNSIVPISSYVIAAGSPYLILGETQYAYSPVIVTSVIGAMSISGSIFMVPRSATQIAINTSQ